ncbi:5-bromo-4-chloroindolyl phosphate hydrolysis family protein [uncultured Thiodictyon sp.]|uniref:5-bromo-4-chloroindolyl phosphate hydrolysis family protein n=1 Tax=uncultured Thiodictyon sp. TaxID=1846217 RepID=UPI0025EA8317|nr:5-bromo-4-chloroindolyl phosphate hydrolysis family protein [uncultured Thiodictyon sp.]
MTIPPEPSRNLRLHDLPPLVRSLIGAARPGASPLAASAHRSIPLPGRLRTLLQPRPGQVPRRKGALLWVLPAPLLLGAVIALGRGHLDSFLADAGGFALFMAAAWLTKRGIRADYAGPQPRFARLARWPLKTLGGVLTAIGAGVTAHFAAGHGPGISLAFAAVSAIGFHLAYGLEPLGRPRSLRSGDEPSRRVAEALAEAEGRLLDLEQTAQSLTNPELKARLTRLGAQGRGILDQIADRPTDLYRARKFLNVYLEGVQQVAAGYASTHRRAESRELEQNFRNVLVTVEEVFEEQRQRLLETDVLDLDIQIEVLKKQLEREGIV